MRVFGLLKKHGPVGLAVKWIEKKTDRISRNYAAHYAAFLPTAEELESQRQTAEDFAYRPIISIVVPAYRTPEVFLRSLLESVLAQTYGNWELCIVDATDERAAADEKTATGDIQPHADTSVYDVVQEYRMGDTRIRYQKLHKNGGISQNTNVGFAMAEGEYIALLDHDDILSPNALYEVVRKLNEAEYGLIYSDEDKTDESGETFFEPHFKPDYNEELLNHYNYICHFLVVQRRLLESVGGLNSEYDGAQDYDFVLRCTEALSKDRIAHIPKVLYHWRVHQASTANYSGSKDYAYEAGRRAVQEHMNRVGEAGSVMAAKGREYVVIKRDGTLPENRFMTCLASDCSVITKDYIEQFTSYFLKNSKDGPIGMVGGKLVTSSPGMFRKIVACGYSFDQNGRVFPLFQGMHAWKKGYFRRAAVAWDISGVSLDFCMIDKAAYEAVGGFDESLPSPYRDMDFSFRLQKAGYRVILASDVVAVCKGKNTDSSVPEAVRSLFLKRWESVITKGDRCYNENFSGNGYI